MINRLRDTGLIKPHVRKVKFSKHGKMPLVWRNEKRVRMPRWTKNIHLSTVRLILEDRGTYPWGGRVTDKGKFWSQTSLPENTGTREISGGSSDYLFTAGTIVLMENLRDLLDGLPIQTIVQPLWKVVIPAHCRRNFELTCGHGEKTAASVQGAPFNGNNRLEFVYSSFSPPLSIPLALLPLPLARC